MTSTRGSIRTGAIPVIHAHNAVATATTDAAKPTAKGWSNSALFNPSFLPELYPPSYRAFCYPTFWVRQQHLPKLDLTPLLYDGPILFCNESILERGERLLRGYEPEIGRALGDILRAEGLDVRTGARVIRVRADHGGVVVTAEIDGREHTFAAARMLVATGRQPNTAGVGLEDAGVWLDARGAVVVDESLRTRVPSSWAAGDVIGAEQDSQMAAPVGVRDAGIAAHTALSSAVPRHVDHRVIPRAVFTDPQVGAVGLTDEEANAAGHTC